jgi:hypothetical protein
LIGGDWDDPTAADPLQAGALFNPAGSQAFINSQWVHDRVTYNRYPANRYRFVFLDACETSAGSWPQAFGIPKQTNSLSYYEGMAQFPKLLAESRPSVFVGWEVIVGGTAEWGSVQGSANFRNSWIGDWGNGSRFYGRPTLVHSLERGLEQSSWIPKGKLDETMRIYGYSDMRFRDYNRKGEWPP